MKLLFCPECGDVVKLLSELRHCRCRRAYGRYLDDEIAVVGGTAEVLLLDSRALQRALLSRHHEAVGAALDVGMVALALPDHLRVKRYDTKEKLQAHLATLMERLGDPGIEVPPTTIIAGMQQPGLTGRVNETRWVQLGRDPVGVGLVAASDLRTTWSWLIGRRVRRRNNCEPLGRLFALTPRDGRLLADLQTEHGPAEIDPVYVEIEVPADSGDADHG